MTKNLIRSQLGSALLSVMAAVFVVGLMAASVMQIAASNSATAKSNADMTAMFSMMQTAQAVLGNDVACLGHGPFKGLEFKSGSGYGQNAFNYATASAAAGQDIRIGTHLNNPNPPSGSSNPYFIESGAVYTPTDFRIDKLTYYVTGNPLANTYTGYVMMQGTANASTATPHKLASRNIGSLTISVSPPALQSCHYTQSAQTQCEAMGCMFNPSNTAQKCLCGFPPVSCPATPGQPRKYISAIDQSTMTPTCTTLQLDCSDPAYGGKGPGYFFAGIDSSGQPICVPVEGYVQGQASNPNNGTCGPASSGAFPNLADVTAAGLCSAGTAGAVSPPGMVWYSPYSGGSTVGTDCSPNLGNHSVQGGTGYSMSCAYDPSQSWSWLCQGQSGGSSAVCYAAVPTLNGDGGICGSADGVTTASPPTSNLCTNGNATPVGSSGTSWTWQCLGNAGGSNSSCAAPK